MSEESGLQITRSSFLSLPKVRPGLVARGLREVAALVPSKPFSETRRLAEQGDADAQFCLGLAYGSGKGVAGDLTEAKRWYRKAADQGHAEAQFTLAFYYLGSDEPQDHTEAARLFRQAADHGHGEAQYWLGTCYGQGEGVPQDCVLAHTWFSISASTGSAADQERRVQARDEIARKMPPGQIAEAQRLAQEWMPTPKPERS